jgi:hypothetical protein
VPVQYVAAASQKFTCPLVTATAPVFTVAVNVTTLPDSTVVKRREFSEVHGDGRRVDITMKHVEALEYAQAAALEFGVGNKRIVQFDKEKAKADISEESGKSKKKKNTKTVDAEE